MACLVLHCTVLHCIVPHKLQHGMFSAVLHRTVQCKTDPEWLSTKKKLVVTTQQNQKDGATVPPPTCPTHFVQLQHQASAK